MGWIVLAAFAVSLLGTGLSIRLACRLGAVDSPGPVKIHCGAVPRLGGLGIIAGTIGAVLAWSLAHDLGREGLGFLAGAGVVVTVGLLDDIRGLRPWPKLLLTAVAGACLALGSVPGNHALVPLMWAVVVVVVVTVCHAINLVDGLDGLAAGVSGIAAPILVLGAGASGLVLALGAGLLGGVLGFFPWNWHPARTFMGDVGSLFLGYTLAALVVMRLGEAEGWSRLLGSMVTLGVPLGDVGLTLVRRTVHRRPLFSPDRFHFYNILMIQGLSHRQTVVLACLMGVLFGGLGVTVSRLSRAGAIVALVIVAAACLVAAWRLGFLEDWQRIADTGERLA